MGLLKLISLLGHMLGSSVRANYCCPTFSSSEINEFLELKNSLNFDYLMNRVILYRFQVYKGQKPFAGSYRKDADSFIRANNCFDEVFLMNFGEHEVVLLLELLYLYLRFQHL